MRYGYTEYVRTTLHLAGVDLESKERSTYEGWTPYLSGRSEDRLQGAEEVEPQDGEDGSTAVSEA